MLRLGTSTTIAFNRPNGQKESLPRAVEICGKAGYKILDMNFHDCANFETPLLTNKWEFWVDEIANSAAKYNIEFSQSHLHFYEFLTASDEEKAKKEEIIDRCLKASSILGVKWAVTHAATAFYSVHMRDDSLRGNQEYFKRKLEVANRLGVSLAIENLWDLNIAPQKRYTATAEELVELVDCFQSDQIGIAWDFEHAAIMNQDQIKALRYIGKRLKATHVSDHYGIDADHQLPYFGSTKWEQFLPILKEIGYRGDFVYETHRYTQNMPDELMDAALKFSIEVGNHLIDIIENGKIK
ncbi:MAG: sugar phosphate isomerase/epimerase family protein [Hungatella sp.]